MTDTQVMAALEPFARIAEWVEHTDLRDGDVVHRQRTPTGETPPPPSQEEADVSSA